LTKRRFLPKLPDMNRLTAIGLASLVAYGLLITSKYVGVVSAARQDDAPQRAVVLAVAAPERVAIAPVNAEPRQTPISLPTPVPRAEPVKASATALEFRSTRDLKAFADSLAARRDSLTADERYHLAKALEECQFATNVNEDLAAYSAKQRRAFLATLPAGDPLNVRRIAAYEAVDNTQRCLRFQGSKISPRDIEDLFQFAAQQGDPRAQARLLVADLNNKNNSGNKGNGEQSANTRVQVDEMQHLISLLESRDPEATMIVGQFLASNAVANQLRIGPNGETPEPSAFLGAFSLVACQLGPDCISMTRDPQAACAYGAYCSATSYEELFQNFLASPWVYSQAMRYSAIITTAINSRNWSLIGLQPPSTEKRRLAGQ
jgi:hypothetical protein